MLYTAPPGLKVMVGHSPGEPGPEPQNRNWLTVTVTVADGLPAVSVPDAGDTLTRPSGSPAMVTDQLTVPPEADSWICVPGPSGATMSGCGRDWVPPAGEADSVPVGAGVGVGVGEGERDGLPDGDVLTGGELVVTGGGALLSTGASLVLTGAGFDVARAGLRGADVADGDCRAAPAVAGWDAGERTEAAGRFGSAAGVKR